MQRLLWLAATFAALCLLHAPLLDLPYFWDEAGYFVPAARDLLLSGALIPSSTLSNAHPPLVLLWLAGWWKLLGYSTVVTRVVMLLAAAIGLAGLYRLARGVAGSRVAIVSAACTAIYPVFFVQSSLAQLDLPAAALSFWGLAFYLEKRPRWSAVLFSLACLAKETALVTPLALFTVEAIRRRRDALWMLAPIAPLALWFAFHYSRTGYLLGNAEFYRYNVAATLSGGRIAIAFLLRLWQVFGHMNLFVLTLPAAWLLLWRRRAPTGWPVDLIAVIAANIAVFSLVGGAVLARYMLTAVPLVILLAVWTLERSWRNWRIAVGVAVAAFALGLFIEPSYHAAFEDNLAYHRFVRLHQAAAAHIEHEHSGRTILTSWPALEELTRPYLGYVNLPQRVVGVRNFEPKELEDVPAADLILVFPTKHEPSGGPLRPGTLLRRLRFWQTAQERYFEPDRELSPEQIAKRTGGRIIFREGRGSQFVALILMPQAGRP